MNTELENKHSEKRKLNKEIADMYRNEKEFKINHFKYRTSSNMCCRQKSIKEH